MVYLMLVRSKYQLFRMDKPMAELTIFDKILSGDIPAEKVYEDEFVFAFRDVNPQAPIHVLVIPKNKIMGFSEVQDQDVLAMGEYMVRISKVASELNLDKAGYRVVFNQGHDGGQTVEYIHAHIIGGRELNWPPG
jgi:histidine triad (HIT) family protein